jgi:hypothetical protein
MIVEKMSVMLTSASHSPVATPGPAMMSGTLTPPS